jgi:hypothetical protein
METIERYNDKIQLLTYPLHLTVNVCDEVKGYLSNCKNLIVISLYRSIISIVDPAMGQKIEFFTHHCVRKVSNKDKLYRSYYYIGGYDEI